MTGRTRDFFVVQRTNKFIRVHSTESRDAERYDWRRTERVAICGMQACHRQTAWRSYPHMLIESQRGKGVPEPPEFWIHLGTPDVRLATLSAT